jgi:hypothetical protein
VLLVLTVVSGAALGLVAGKYDWSDLAIYGAMTAVIAVLGVLALLSMIRQGGPEIFAERKRRSSGARS